MSSAFPHPLLPPPLAGILWSTLGLLAGGFLLGLAVLYIAQRLFRD